MAAQPDRQVSGNEYSGLVGPTRPKPARRVAPKQPDGKISLFLFRFYEAAVRDLTQPGPGAAVHRGSNIDCFYEDSFVKPLLIAAFMGGTSWTPHEGMWGTWHGATRSCAAS